MKCMTTNETIDGLQEIIDRNQRTILPRVHIGYLIHAVKYLKEQKEEIENLKQTAQSMMEGICLLKEPEAMNVDAFVQWCIDSHIMGDATVRGIKYWVGKYKEIKKGR